MKRLTTLVFFLCCYIGISNAQTPQYAPPIQNPFGLEYEVGEDEHIWTRLVDINGDGILEAFIFIGGDNNGTPCCGEILYFENNGSNAEPDFVAADHSDFGMEEISFLWPWNFLDIDGDGDYDLSYFGFLLDAPVRILMNEGTATEPMFADNFELNPFGITLPESDFPPGNLLDGVIPTFADLDQDCDLDVMLNGRFANNLPDEEYIFSENTGTFYEPEYAALEYSGYGTEFPGGGYHQSTFVDLDCDGDQDMYAVIVTSSGVNMWYHENTPDGTGKAQFTTPPQFWHPLDSVDIRFLPVDGTYWDHGDDGDLDLLCGGTKGIFFWENTLNSNCNYSQLTPEFSISENTQGFTFTDESGGNPTEWLWDFGDGETSTEQNPTHNYTSSGNFTVCLTVWNEFSCQGLCRDSIISGTRDFEKNISITLAPNPVKDELQVTIQSEKTVGTIEWSIMDVNGQSIISGQSETAGTDLYVTIDTHQLAAGLYFLRLKSAGTILSQKIVKR
jgi:hypothetical protein